MSSQRNNCKKILFYDNVDVSDGIDVNHDGCSHEWIMCHLRYVLHVNFRCELKVCDDEGNEFRRS